MLDRSPYLEPLVAEAHEERWCVLLANRRNARFFVGDGGGLEETDRVEDDVHSQHDQGGWSQARYQRGVEKEKDDHLVHVAEVAFGAYKERGFDRLLVGAPDELVGDLEQKLHPYLRERIVARLHLDVENSVDRGRARRGGRGDRGLAAARASARRSTGWPRASGAAAAARRAGGRAAGAQRAARRDAAGRRRRSAPPAAATRRPGCSTRATTGPDGQELERCENIVEPAIEKAIEQSAR